MEKKENKKLNLPYTMFALLQTNRKKDSNKKGKMKLPFNANFTMRVKENQNISCGNLCSSKPSSYQP